MQSEIQKFKSFIETSKKILLINHIRMDGDALGSLGGIYFILKKLGKDVRAINDCPIPSTLQFLGNIKIIESDLDVEAFNPDCIIALDSSDTDRLGESYVKWKHVFDATTLINIDHHISNPLFGDINIFDQEASSVCEIVTKLIQDLDWGEYLTSEVATYLYTGLQTDSNMYFNTNTRPETLKAGAYLIEKGADFRKPIYELYKKRTRKQLQVWTYALSQIEYHNDGNICSCILTREGLRSLGIPKEEIGEYFKGFISEILINIEGVNIAYLIYPLDVKENKVSMRSQEGYDMREICEVFGGGGHKQAAGFQSFEKIETINQRLLEEIDKKYK